MPILSHITFGDGLTNHLNELRAECEQCCKKQDSDLAQYVDYNEAANEAAMHLDMGVPKEKAIAASVEAVLYTAKQAASVAKAREFEQAELKANTKNMQPAEAAAAKAAAEKAAAAALEAEKVAAAAEQQKEKTARSFEAFRAFDVDNNGVLDTSEVLAILTRPTTTSQGGKPLSVEDAKTFIAAFDENGDGMLSYSEFTSAFGSIGEQQAAAPTGANDSTNRPSNSGITVAEWRRREHSRKPPQRHANDSLRGKNEYAAGVGSAFEFLLSGWNEWIPIRDEIVIDELGALCSYNATTQVIYQLGGQAYKAVQQRNGMIEQTNVETGTTRLIRLMPFFFEFEKERGVWAAVTEPEALMSLTAVLTSSLPKIYTYTDESGTTHTSEAILINEKGLLQQRNVTTQKTRRIRPTPIGPDGMAYWECKDAEGRWRAIPTASCAQMMWVVAAGGGRGDACYKMSVAGLGDTGGQKVTFSYKVSLKDDGFPTQLNLSSRAERPLRPAPWLGHGVTRWLPHLRADPTNGYYRGQPSAERKANQAATRTGVGTYAHWELPPAQSFYVPGKCMMGTEQSPVLMKENDHEVEPAVPQSYVYYPWVESRQRV